MACSKVAFSPPTPVQRGCQVRFKKESGAKCCARPGSTSLGKTKLPTVDVRSVNYFISRTCNYSCKFCFHTQKNHDILSIEDARRGIQLLRDAGTEKINFAGGEPFLHPRFLGELCKECFHLGIAVSIISNGSLITPSWMLEYGGYVDILGVSIDSFDGNTNAAIGRGGESNNKHIERALRTRELCARHDILFKMNTVVCRLNWQEDMREHIKQLDPMRWKVFQVLLLENENTGLLGELRNARPLAIEESEFWSFVFRHSEFGQLVPEANNVMQNSYLMLDEKMRFLDCSGGGKVAGRGILDVGVAKAYTESGFDRVMFEERGGVYDWRRDRQAEGE